MISRRSSARPTERISADSPACRVVIVSPIWLHPCDFDASLRPLPVQVPAFVVREFRNDLFAEQPNGFQHPLMFSHPSVHDEDHVVDIQRILETLDFLADLVGSADDLQAALEHLLEGLRHRPFLALHPQRFEKAELAEPMGPECRALPRRLHRLFVGLADRHVAAKDDAASRGILAEAKRAAMLCRLRRHRP